MEEIPSLPEPGNQGPEDRRAISRRFIMQARNELEKGHRLQAGDKAWAAVAQHLKIVGHERGWQHTAHRQVESIGRHIRAEYPDLDSAHLADTLSDAYRVGHINFYENQEEHERIAALVDDVERELPNLKRLAREAAENPRPFQIATSGQRRQLREVTGDRMLDIGDSSPVGFSLRHPEPRDGGGSS